MVADLREEWANVGFYVCIAFSKVQLIYVFVTPEQPSPEQLDRPELLSWTAPIPFCKQPHQPI
jgi:hypothetical protein